MLSSYTYVSLAASALVRTGPGGLYSLVLAAGSDTATVIVYDNTSAAGSVICELSAVANTSESAILNVAASKGLYAALTGTAPKASLSYW